VPRNSHLLDIAEKYEKDLLEEVKPIQRSGFCPCLSLTG
jgi:hypothetical protein